ncbi:hypothetical protein RMCBS344292_01831 [Rhizopus microsporus]|nr:hypothetical protein RMCBS344292_01831 [Rhizopus microsporus]
MQVVYCEDEFLHNPPMELTRGEWKPYVESPKRLEAIKQVIDQYPSNFEVIQANDYSLKPILDVHPSDYIQFLTDIYHQWIQAGYPPDACVADTFASITRTVNRDIVKQTANASLSGKLGFYTSDLSVMFMKDTWKAVYASAQVVLTAAHQLLLTSAPAIYALCRPPGHHASDSVAAGYCYINNVAVAARFIQNYTLEDMNKIKKTYNGDNVVNRTENINKSNEKKKVLIIDIDYHHGNGTQEIFYDDPTVFYISLHGHPDYPYFTGSAQETGSGQGLGYTMNIPLLSTSTTDAIYLDSLNHALQDERVVRFNADIVIVSLGLDTWHEDPIAGMKGLQDPNTYKAIGALIKSSNGTKNRPVLFVQEGGYTIDKLGQLAVNVLKGFMEQ